MANPLVIATPFSGRERPFFPQWLAALRRLHFDPRHTLVLWLDNGCDAEFHALMEEAALELRDSGMRIHLCSDNRAYPSTTADSSSKSSHVADMWRRIRDEVAKVPDWFMTAGANILCLESDAFPPPYALDRMEWWLDALPTAGAVSAMVPYRPATHDSVYPMCWSIVYERLFPEEDSCHDITPRLRIIGPMRRGMTRVDATGFSCLLLKWSVFLGLSLMASPDGLSYDHHAGQEIQSFGKTLWVDWETRCRHRDLVVPGLPFREEEQLHYRIYRTGLGSLRVTTDCGPLLWTFDRRAIPHEVEGTLDVDLRWGSADQIEAFVGTHLAGDQLDRRLVRVLDAAFVIAPGHLCGVLHHRSINLGLVIDWIWLALPVLFPPPNFSPIHAGAVTIAGKVTLFVGESGSGKTHQLERALGQGGRLLADDIVLVNAQRQVARGWDRTLHVSAGAGEEPASPTLDSAGKLRVVPERIETALDVPIGDVLFLADDPNISMQHRGDGFGAYRPQDSQTMDWLRKRARCVGWRPPSIADIDRVSLDDCRIVLTNRNPDEGEHAGFGGDMVHLYGYLEALRKRGIAAEFVPVDRLDPSRCDLILLFHTQMPWSRELVARDLGDVPLVVSAITHGRPDRNDWAAVVTRASHILCYSQSEAKFYQDAMPEVASKLRVVPMGLPDSVLDAPMLAAPAEPHSVFMPARYCPYKKQLQVLQACRELDVPVVFAGPLDHPEYEAYRGMLEAAADGWNKATFHGLLHGDDLWRLYQEAWVCANAGWEPFGLVKLEALHFECNLVYAETTWADSLRPFGTSCRSDDVGSIRDGLELELGRPRGWAAYRPPSWNEAVEPVLIACKEALLSAAGRM